VSPPVVEIIEPESICAGTDVILRAIGAVRYEWSTGETGDQIVINSDKADVTYIVTGYDNFGCVATDLFTINAIKSSPVPSITTANPVIDGKAEVCAGSSLVLTAEPSGDYDYWWGSAFPTSPSVTVTPEEEETTYTVRVTDQSTKCSASASITVKVNKLPAVYLPFDTVVCPDQPVVIPAKGPDTYQYEWTNASGDFIGETNMLTRTFTAAEELTLTITDYKQCETKKKVMVEILPSFTMTVTGKYETCFGDEVTLTASEATSYLWSTGETTKEIKVRPLAPTTYRVTGANDKGCMATSEFTVTTVHPLPQPVITVPDPGILIIEGKPEICEGQSITLKAAAKDDSNAVYSFCNWENNLYSGASITVTPAGDSRYTVTVTDSKGCSAPASIEVKVNKASEIEHIDDRTVCAGSVVVLAAKVADEPGYLYKWYEWNGNIKTPLTDEGSDARELVLTPVQNKRISVEVYGLDVDNKKKCTAMQEDILINVVHSPVVYVVESNENPDVVCAGATVTLTAYGAATYKWSTTGVNGNYTLEGDHIEVKPEMNSTYWVKGADSHGCTTTASKTVKNIRTLPSPTVSVGSGLPVLGVTTDGKPEICSGSSIELVASVNDPNGTYTYNWTHNSSNSPSVTVAPEDGETGYSVVVADGNGCSATASITVRVISMPELEPLDDMVVCPSQPFIIDAKATGLGLTYLWSTGEKSATIEIIPTSRQNMWVEVSNLRNCKVKDEFTVDVLPSLTPKLKIVGINENCAGGAIQLTASGADNYLWNTGETSAGITVNPTSPTTYIVTGTDGNGGCPVTAEYTVSSVKSLPVPGISGKTDICAGESVTLTASGGNTYRWANHTSFDSTLTVTPEADATYTVTITGDNDCSVDTSITVKVHNYPKVEPLDDMIICPNQSVILRAQSEDIGLTYLWSAGDTASVMEFTPAETQNVWVEVTNYKNCTTKEELLIEVLPSSVLKILSDNNNCSGETVKLFASGGDNYVWSTGETTDTIYVSPDIAITYQVAGTDNYGCPATASYDLKMGTLPVAVVEGKTDICAGESATLTASGGGSYKWANNSALSNSILVTPAHDSTFVVRVTTDAGCYADVSKTVTVHQPPLLEPFTDTIVCPGQRVVLQAKASGMGLTYLWDTGDKTDVIEFVARENTELTVEVFNMKHCSTTEKIAIEVWPLPPVKITGSQAICAGSELTLTASGAESYTWNTGFTGSDYTLKPENGNEYTVTGVDQHGCKATVSTGVIVDKPAATINVNPKYIWENASDVHFETVTGITEYEVLWDFGDGVWSSFPEVDHHYHITGNEPQFNVVFSIVDKNGCSDTIRETVSVDIHPVTVFFPNLNQVFMSNCEVCQNIEIYDRSGIKLYEGSSGWDGTYKGRLLEPDTYFYVITLKFDMGGTNIRKGYITVGKDGRTK
jgi:hypothetical protein